MENNKKDGITVEDLLRQTSKELSEIKFPATNLTTSVELYQNVSVPVARAIDAIEICLKVFEHARTAKPQVAELTEVNEDQVPKDAEVVDLGSFDEEASNS